MPTAMSGVDKSKEQYASYRAEVRGDRMLGSLRAGILIVAGLYTPFLVLDYFVYRERFWALAIARGSIAAFLAVAYRIAPLAPQRTMVCSVLAVGFNLVAVIGLVGGVSSLYFPGIMLLFLGMPVLLPLAATQSAWIVSTLFLAFASLPLFSAGEFASREYFVNLFFPGAAAVESVFSCALLDRLRFVDYCRREEIAAARDELAKLDDAKTRFSANVHHELRTPLTLLLAPLDGILDGEYGRLSDETQKIIGTMRSNGQRLLKLINNLLDLAKLEDQKFSIQRLPLSTTDIVHEIVEGTRSFAELKGVSIDAEALGHVRSVFADRDALDKVFMNLLGNALKFTASGGSITIESEDVDEGVVIRVIDSGIGLAPEQLDRIFDRFAQVDTSATREHEGTGIGLSLASELVRLHGGRLWATSPGVGLGTTMSVYLPIGSLDSDDESALVEDAADESPESLARRELREETQDGNSRAVSLDSSSQRFVDLDAEVRRWADQSNSFAASAGGASSNSDDRKKILVVDDNPDMRDLLSHILGKRFAVRCARNGREALEILENYEPLLVVTDIMMPEVSGTELCEKIKSSDRLSGIPVMMISSKAEGEMRVKGLELGADDYVTKPFHPREVMARATSLVDLRSAQNEISLRNAELQAALDELRVAQDRLIQSERLAAVGEIAAGIAHEVNNPVNFSLNAARALQSSTSDLREITESVTSLDWENSEKLAIECGAIQNRIEQLGMDELSDTVDELASIIEQGLERTSKLVGDLRDFAAPECSAPDRDFDARGVVETTLQLLGHEFSRLGIELECSLSDEPMMIRGDDGAFGQVLLNLLKNAVQALEFWEDKPIELRSRIELVGSVQGAEIVVEVSDNGPGMDSETLTRLFDPFFTTKETGVGTGLGLSTCKGIVNAHGGRIEVLSEPGCGSTFRIVLPFGNSAGSSAG